MRTKRISLLVALVFLIGAMTLPMTAFAAGDKDTTPPTLTAVLDEETVKIVSSDDNSGVEAVYIDKTRVNSLVDGKASVSLKDYAGTDKKVSVYAVDYAGNRSDTVKFDNPYYKEPAPTEKPAAPTQASQSSTPATKPAQTPAASSGSTGTGTQSGNSGSSNTGTASGGTNSQGGSSGSTGNSGTPEPTTSSVPDGAFTPEGTGTVLDSATGEDGDKQFYTITTEAGNVFYFRTANLRPCITEAVNQDTKQKNDCKHSREHQGAIHIKFSRPKGQHRKIQQHEQTAGKQALQNRCNYTNVKVFVFLQHLFTRHGVPLLPTDR